MKIQRIIKSYLVTNVLLFMCLLVLSINWLVDYYKNPENPDVLGYNARTLVILIVLSNVAYWKSINYFRIHPKTSEKIAEFVMTMAIIFAPLLFAISSETFSYALLFIISSLYTIFVERELVVLVPLSLMKLNFMSILLIIFTFYFMLRYLFLLEVSKKTFYFGLLLEAIALTGSLFGIKLLLAVLIIAVGAILGFKIIRIFSKRYFSVRLLSYSLLALLLSMMPISEEHSSKECTAMFHATIASTYMILFITFMISLGRRGLVIFPRGYKNYITLVYIGIAIMLIHVASFFMRNLFFPSLLLLAVYGISFIIISKFYLEKHIIDKEDS